MLIIKIVLILITDFLWQPLKFLTQGVSLTCLSLFLALRLSLFTYKNEIKNSNHFTGLWQEIREKITLTVCKTTHCQRCKLWLLFSLTLQVCSSHTGEGGTLQQCSSNINMPQKHGECLLKHRFLDTTPRNPDSVRLWQGLRMCISSKLARAVAVLGFRLWGVLHCGNVTGGLPIKSWIDPSPATRL